MRVKPLASSETPDIAKGGNVGSRRLSMEFNSGIARKRYAAMSDEELHEINRDDLVEEARRIYDEEVASRTARDESMAESVAELETVAESVAELKTDDYLSLISGEMQKQTKALDAAEKSLRTIKSIMVFWLIVSIVAVVLQLMR
jgi:hypothetical protein